MMTQSNLDYLLQVTAPLADRALGSIGASSFDRPGFGDHLAQATGSKVTETSNTHRRERPAPSGPFESSQSVAEPTRIVPASSGANSSAEEQGECAQADLPAACGGEEPESRAAGTEEPPASHMSSDKTSAGQTDARNESESESDEEGEDPAGKAVIVAGRDVAVTANSLQAELPDAVTQADQTAGEESAEFDADRFSSHREQSQNSSSGTAKSAISTEFSGDLRKLDVELKPEKPVQSSTLNISDELQSAAVTTTKSGDEQSAADADKAFRNSLNARGKTEPASDAAGDRVLPTAVATAPSSNQNTSTAARRPGDKVKPADDSRRRTNEKGESRTAHRTDAAAANPATGSAIVSDIRVDAAATASAANHVEEPALKAGSASGAKSDALVPAFGRGNRGNGVAGRAGRADNPNSLPRIDTSRFVGRVAKAIQTANERGGALQLRLSPPELGSLRLQLTVHEGVMTASLEAESPAARQLLLDHLPSLRDRLAEQNIRIDRFDVDVRHEGSSGQQDPRASQHEQRQQQSQHSAPQRERTHAHPSDGSMPESTTLPSRTTDNELNVLA